MRDFDTQAMWYNITGIQLELWHVMLHQTAASELEWMKDKKVIVWRPCENIFLVVSTEYAL